MIINEKGLLRRMKQDLRQGGYMVARDDSRLYVYGEEWAVRYDWKNVPRKVMALLVEHIGEIPAKRTAYEVCKKIVQDHVFDFAEGDLEDYFGTGEGIDIHRTALSYGEAGVWLSNDGRIIATVSPDNECLMDLNAVGACGAAWFAGRIFCDFQEEAISIETVHPTGSDAQFLARLRKAFEQEGEE